VSKKKSSKGESPEKKGGKKRRRRASSAAKHDWGSWFKNQWEGFKAGVAAGVDLSSPKPGQHAFDDREWASGARYAEALQVIADRAARYLGRVSAGEDPVDALGGGPPAPGKN